MTWKLDHEVVGGFTQHDFLDRESLKRFERIMKKAAEEAMKEAENLLLQENNLQAATRGWKGLSHKILGLNNLLQNRRETLPFKIIDTVIPGSTGVCLVKGHLLVHVFSSSELRFYALKSQDSWKTAPNDQTLYLGYSFENNLKIEVPGPWEKEIQAIPELVENAIAQVKGRIETEKNQRVQEFAKLFK